jgi:hypothetical protein
VSKPFTRLQVEQYLKHARNDAQCRNHPH